MKKQDKKFVINKLEELMWILRESCHAPGCINPLRCPVNCSCRYKRKFKLNIDTAFCWEVANIIDRFLRNKYKHTFTNFKRYYNEYTILSRFYSYHPTTKAWGYLNTNISFFVLDHTYDLFDTSLKLNTYEINSKKRYIEKEVKDIEHRLKVLKRFPKGGKK